MKKVIPIVVSILGLAVTITVVLAVLYYTGVISSDVVEPKSVSVYEDESGLKYTEASWDWKPTESGKVISYHESVTAPTTQVILELANCSFYKMTIPDVPYIYDFGKTVWAVDGSFMIRVIGGADMSNLSAIAGIDNGENMNQFTIRNKDGVKGQRVLATLIGDTAIVVNVYEGDNNFSILLNSISENRDVLEIEEVPFARSLKELDSISYSGEFTHSVRVSDVSLYQNKYLFESGCLWSQGVVKSFNDTCRDYMIKLTAFSKTGLIEEMYNNGRVLYAKSGDYHLAVIAQNSNTCLVIVGQGDEAKCNVIYNISMW